MTGSLQAPKGPEGSEQIRAEVDSFLAESRRVVTNYLLECRGMMRVSDVAELKYKDQKQHGKEGSFHLRAPRSHYHGAGQVRN